MDSESAPGPDAWDTSFFVGFCCESVIWALYCILFVYTMLGWRKLVQNIPILSATIFLFLVCTTHFAIAAHEVYVQNIPANGLTGISLSPLPELAALAVLSGLANLIGDGLFIYRLWIVYQKLFLIVLFPIIVTLFGFACLLANVGLSFAPDSSRPSDDITHMLYFSSYVAPLFVNAFTTVLISWRVWSVTRHDRAPISQPAKRVFYTVVESGLLYLLVQTAVVTIVVLNIPEQTIITYFAIPLYGIVPTLITAGVNSQSLFRPFTGLATGPVRTTHIPVVADDYVMSHLSGDTLGLDKGSIKDEDDDYVKDFHSSKHSEDNSSSYSSQLA